MDKIVIKNIFDLKPHQENIKIYGKNEDVSDVKASILTNGLSYELTISDNNTIISGHRRWKALTELVKEGHSEFAKVKCIVKHYDTANDELKAVIIANSQRTKNLEQIGREALFLKEIHSSEAEKRMKAGKKSDPMADLPKGSTRDLIAQELFSTGNKWITPKNIDILVQSITKLDEFEKNGDSFNADVLRHELHKDKHNFAAISKLTKNIDEISEENKKRLLDDKITVNDAVKAVECISDTDNDIDYPNEAEETDTEILCTKEQKVNAPSENDVLDDVVLTITDSCRKLLYAHYRLIELYPYNKDDDESCEIKSPYNETIKEYLLTIMSEDIYRLRMCVNDDMMKKDVKNYLGNLENDMINFQKHADLKDLEKYLREFNKLMGI